MSDNDPFSAFESDRTIIKPSAGRGPRPGAVPGAPAGQAPAPAMHAPAAGHTYEPTASADVPGGSGLNPLLQAAAPLLSAAPRIRAMPQHPNPSGLRAALVEGVRRFEQGARSAGLPNDQVVAGRYVLCTLLDESASSTPWGGSGAWSSQSLLVHFHNEAWGGEKVFQLMGKLAENVPNHRNLLELMSATLALGLEGRYRVLDNGRAQLEGVRQKLVDMLRQHAGPLERDLSPRWEGVQAAGGRLRDGIPVWVVAAASAVLLALVFTGLRFVAANHTDSTFATLQALDVKNAPPPPPAPPAAQPRLSGFLKPEVDAGQVEVRDLADKSIVTIRGDGFFESGSADVSDRVKPLLGRISDALSRTPGQVLITGHTDNVPSRSLRYPSNFHLSQSRADSVKALLSATVKPERMRAEGLADSSPLDTSNTPAGRAKNRRVEITLTAATGG